MINLFNYRANNILFSEIKRSSIILQTTFQYGCLTADKIKSEQITPPKFNISHDMVRKDLSDSVGDR